MNKKEHPTSPAFEYNLIVDGIYVGTNQCCQMHFEEKLLRGEGIEADISLEEERIDEPYGVKYFLWLPVKDKTAPLMNQLELGVDMIKKLVAMKSKVYIHCQFGHGRSPTLVAAYLIDKGMTVNEAVEFVTQKRPTIHLEKSQQDVLDKFIIMRR